MMRATTLKAGGAGVAGLVGYYAGLAEDQLKRYGRSRGPIDYYLDPNEPPGQWWGGGSPAVELSGDVRPEHLEAMLGGRHPADGRQLGRGFGAKSARAFDATFSAPKSVSVLWAMSPDASVQAEVLAAHDAAAVAALDWLEQHGGVTRRGRNGVHQVDANGLVAALFRQHTSRDVDPQLHTHAVIWAKVQDPAGKWLSLDARFLKQQQRSIGWVYAAALRSELSARLGVSWGPVSEGHADIDGVPPGMLTLFSQRNAEVDAKLAEAVAAWVDDHDGAEPDSRTLYRLERNAVLDSRPGKSEPVPADELRREWVARAQEAGFESPAFPRFPLQPTQGAFWDDEAVIAQALDMVGSSSSTWLRADLAREIAARLPAEAARSAADLVRIVDELAERACQRCVELHPPARKGAASRRDGRPITEHVVERRLSTPAMLEQEARLLRWARASIGTRRPSAPGDDAYAVAARDVAGDHRLVLVVGPAGAGKTTMLGTAVAELAVRGRVVVGLAPSGKASDVLGRETGSTATTLAKLLHEYGRGDGPQPEWHLGPGLRSSSTRPGWRRPTTSLAWSPWPTATTGDWCASGTRPSYRQWAEVACSPIGAQSFPPATSARCGASPSRGRRRPACFYARAILTRPRSTPSTDGCAQSIPPSSPTGSPASTNGKPQEAPSSPSPPPPPAPPEPSTSRSSGVATPARSDSR